MENTETTGKKRIRRFPKYNKLPMLGICFPFQLNPSKCIVKTNVGINIIHNKWIYTNTGFQPSKQGNYS